jgi:iron complex outermembrane receptor protein
MKSMHGAPQVNRRRWLFDMLWCGAMALGALVVIQPVAAQTGPAVPADTGNDQLTEIVVTVEKTAVSLQKTAAAVTAVSGDTLAADGVDDIRAAQILVPAVRFQQEGSSTQIFIRGVGANLDVANVEPNVAFNFNGVLVPREGTSTAFFDVANLEVLPGPQGTLYGRSAVGGAVSVNFNKPANDWAGSTSLEVGDYSLVHVTVAQDVPLSSSLSLRAAVNYVDRSGYEESGADSQNDPAGRLSLLFTPADNFSAYVWTSYARKFGNSPNLVNHGYDPNTGLPSRYAFLSSNPWNDLQNEHIAGLPTNYLRFGEPYAFKQTYESFLNGAQIDWHLGSVTLTYLPSYTFVNSEVPIFLGVIPAELDQRYNINSHELRLVNDKGGPIDWLLGLSTYNQNNTGHRTISEVVVQSDIRDNLIKGSAIFGQGTYHVLDDLRITVGGRYSYDKRDARGYQTANPATGAPIDPFTFDEHYTHFDWKAAVEYDLARQTLAYAAVQTGYEPGTYNAAPNTPTFNNAVQPEHLTAYTTGLKSRFRDDTLQVNTELFYYDYRDLIEQQYDTALAFNPIFNAQLVHIYGAQVDLLWRPSSHDTVNLDPAYTHARNVEFITPIGGNFNGLQVVYSPDQTVVGGYSHELPLPGASLQAHVDARYESGWWATYNHNPGTNQPASVKEDASLTYESDRRWSVGLWVKNLSNVAVLAATAAGGYPGPAVGNLEAPRTFGIRANVSY